MTDIQRKLEKIGLTGNEAKIYLTLLRLGTAKAGKLSKQAGINRTTTYDALKRLLEKGLASYVVKENRKYFQAADPQKIIELLKRKQEDAKEIIPRLNQLFKAPVEKHNVTLYYGRKGVKTVFQDIVREGKPNCVLDAEVKFTEVMPYFSIWFIKQIEKKKIQIRHIARRAVIVKPSKTTQVRYLDFKTKEKSPVSTNIYGDKIAIIMWTDPPEAVIIKSKSAADAYRNYFEFLWGIAGK